MSSIKVGLAAAEAARTAPTIGEADRNSRNASATLAFAQPGDTLLYLLLPVHHAEFGVSLAEAGLLLAANRLVRIAGYGWVARLYADRGPHTACVLAALGSLLATLGYAVQGACALAYGQFSDWWTRSGRSEAVCRRWMMVARQALAAVAILGLA